MIDSSHFRVNGDRWSEAPPTKKARGGHTNYCKAKGCGHYTHGGKDYCTEHVEMAEHAAWVRSELDRRAREVSRVEGGGKPGVDDHLAVEIRRALRTPSTVGLLSRALHEELEVVDAYCCALEDAGKVVIEKPHRGTNVVRLAG